MIKWELCPDNYEGPIWDQELLNAKDSNVFQSYGWGEYKRLSGWTPLRYICRDKNGKIAAMSQILVKRFPANIRVGWSPGGPVFQFPKTNSWDLAKGMKGLFDKIKKEGSKVHVRFNFQVPSNSAFSYSLNQISTRPFFKLNSGYSININLSQPIEALVNRMTSTHRGHLKKSLVENICWKGAGEVSQVESLCSLYNQMAEVKKLRLPERTGSDLSGLCDNLGSYACFFTGYLNNEAVSSCLVLIFGQKAFYMMAATGEKGRQVSASYSMIYRLFEYLKQRGVTEFDFGGIDPRSHEAKGVNDFKRGFGGELVEYLGEWEQASSGWLRWLVNIGIRQKANGL